jgi:uncharacterized protein involved in response to NO
MYKKWLSLVTFVLLVLAHLGSIASFIAAIARHKGSQLDLTIIAVILFFSMISLGLRRLRKSFSLETQSQPNPNPEYAFAIGTLIVAMSALSIFYGK